MKSKTDIVRENDFIKSEMLAEHFIDHIVQAQQMLADNDLSNCLGLLGEVEKEMHLVLAIGERDDVVDTSGKTMACH